MRNINLFLIDEKASIKSAIIKIRKKWSQNFSVSCNKKKLLGTISEGDIQKSILKNIAISNKITNIYNKKPKKISLKKIDRKKIKEIF